MNEYCKDTNNYMQINYHNLQYNYEQIKKYNSQKQVIAVVKNDSYNLGIEKSVVHLAKAGVNFFAVANIKEAMCVKKLLPKARVLVLNQLFDEELSIANELHLDILITDIKNAKNVSSIITNNQYFNIHLHIAINCGMNRYGISKEQITTVHQYLLPITRQVIGLMTHFAVAEENSLDEHYEQISYFKECYKELKLDFQFEVIHSENSATFLQKNEQLAFCNYARVGIILYGYRPIKNDIKLKPTIEYYAPVVKISKVRAGEHLGYGLSQTSQDQLIAICARGYGDGILPERKQAPVVINGKKYQIVAKISMSHMYISVDSSVKVGDKVEIYSSNVNFEDVYDTPNSLLMCALKRRNNDK